MDAAIAGLALKLLDAQLCLTSVRYFTHGPRRGILVNECQKKVRSIYFYTGSRSETQTTFMSNHQIDSQELAFSKESSIMAAFINIS